LEKWVSTDDLMHHFTAALLESASRNGLASTLPLPSTGKWTDADFVKAMYDVGAAIDDAFFGLARSRCPIGATRFGMELMVLSGTLGEALDRYARFYAVVTDGLRLTLHATGEMAQLVIELPEPSNDPRFFLSEWYAARLLSLSQWMIGQELPQVEVEFAHRRQLRPEAYAGALGDKVSFDQPADRLVFPVQYLDRSVIRTLKDLENLASTSFDPEHNRHINRSWSGMLKSSLRASLQRGAVLPTMEELAQEFGVSSQTLRRGLKSEGVSYREAKADARREIVLSKISDTSLTLGEISILAGFAESNGLIRAMRSWTGFSLTALRRSVLEEGRTHD
jgi:AraC-like DNA-binding protein